MCFICLLDLHNSPKMIQTKHDRTQPHKIIICRQINTEHGRFAYSSCYTTTSRDTKYVHPGQPTRPEDVLRIYTVFDGSFAFELDLLIKLNVAGRIGHPLELYKRKIKHLRVALFTYTKSVNESTTFPQCVVMVQLVDVYTRNLACHYADRLLLP